MTFINYAAREINCKIVYYGPGLGGKTANLNYVHAATKPESRGKMISLETEKKRVRMESRKDGTGDYFWVSAQEMAPKPPKPPAPPADGADGGAPPAPAGADGGPRSRADSTTSGRVIVHRLHVARTSRPFARRRVRTAMARDALGPDLAERQRRCVLERSCWCSPGC